MSNTASTQGSTAKNSTAVDEKADIARLAALSALDYDRQREAVAQKLGVRTTTLLLVDELDNGFSVEAKSAILGVMNSGHQRGVLVPRCVGDNHENLGRETA
jgi:hypothetical protein